MKDDYVCGIPVFKFNNTFLGDEVDVFVSAGYHDLREERIPPSMFTTTLDTISEYYEALKELEEIKANRSGAV